MGFPLNYTQKLLPNFYIKFIPLLNSIKITILTILHFIEPEILWPEPSPEFKSISSSLIQEMLPAMKYGEVKKCDPGFVLGLGSESGLNNCTVCLHEFKEHEEIRRLTNCKHILHKACVDRWMDHDQRTCPLCRTPIVPYHLVDVFNERFIQASASASSSCFPEFGSEFSIINSFC